MNKLVVSGKRKTAIAKATIEDGKGNVSVNGRGIEVLPYLQQLELKEPLLIAEEILGKINFDIKVKVKSGGINCRIEAARLAIARAILKFSGDNEELKRAYLTYDRNLLVADTRRKEAYKPDDSKARSKRQTSYR